MSCNYAEGLSKYENKGKLGLPEKFDPPEEIERKVQVLAEWIKESTHTVFHTGAGISTSAGIPDFRGPKGVWTLEKEGLKPDINISWDDARPTLTHMAIVALERNGYVQYVVTQNIDGLHLRSGLQRQKLAELHGDMFVDKCNYCHRQFVRNTAATTVGQKSEGKPCPGKRGNGRRCRGKLHDNVLDWEDGLPDADLDLAISHACAADLSICLGTTLQIVPSGNIPVDTKKRGGKLVICNLQPTKQDRHADLIINAYVDNVMKHLLEFLDIPLLQYDPNVDPMKLTQKMLHEYRKTHPEDNDQNGKLVSSNHNGFEPIEWTIPEEWVSDKELAEKVKVKKVIRNKRQSKHTTNDGDIKCSKQAKINLKSELHTDNCGSEKEERELYCSGNTVNDLNNYVKSMIKCDDSKSSWEQVGELKEEAQEIKNEHSVSKAQNGTN
ncbi:NAD-dependent protein deacetylase Sirt6-like isoform X2 [Homarus americanus]|uniref:protein acetyllysine N-acetyltransferase n=1 Tax=Homarus americanus TaxID=6706 RepID=A0A8J5NA63_HOMAM|nr:NAD-dependent protein deacetylase Sirt6-like isoform X2 [Homarus americanus]XP_042208514.1 NAD-dependent protein deacetylase Sirt6-like isoform X2 [Homarus americanus]XP_042208521.1 NAD-dependent protein deacetylase Sirt6-like isoform X2 [Homarus americanus]KAG7175897.1 NAD-dependent protein deacetylase Sirt6-like [Homarus americanus]